MVKIKLFGKGSLNSLEYPYCVSNPTTRIAVKKYAGTPDLCNTAGIKIMQYDLYTVPDNVEWAYCYEISVPSTSDECLYDITLLDPALTGELDRLRSVTTANETICPGGEKRYIAGPVNRISQTLTESTMVTIQGYGYYSGKLVTSRDAGP